MPCPSQSAAPTWIPQRIQHPQPPRHLHSLSARINRNAAQAAAVQTAAAAAAVGIPCRCPLLWSLLGRLQLAEGPPIAAGLQQGRLLKGVQLRCGGGQAVGYRAAQLAATDQIQKLSCE